jgi:voltage-gated potassium channel
MPQQADPIKQFRLALMALVALVCLGTLGYHILMRWSALDSLYMTIITLATVGYKEVHNLDATGKVFTIVMIIFGVSIVFWAGASLIEAVVGEQMWHAFQRKRMDKHISAIRDHYIVCGYGRMGQQIVKDFRSEKTPHVVIEMNPEQLPKLIAQDIPFVEGDASDDNVLMAAGVKSAKGLITVAPSDEDNVFITLSARALNPNLYIVARSIREENQDKLKMAGANRVMSPYVLGGRRMATAVLRPNVVDFLELALHTDQLQLMVEELLVAPTARLANKTLGYCDIRNDIGAMVLAVKKASGETFANPSADLLIEQGDVLIVLGTPDQLNKAQKLTA